MASSAYRDIGADERIVVDHPTRSLSATARQPGDASRRLRWGLRTMAVVLGALSAWATRHHMNVDGISYLDMGDAFLRGDWTQAINAHWSPLYAALLGLASAVVQPPTYWEFALAHAVNFAIFLAALAAAELLLAEVLIWQRQRAGDGEERASLPEWAWRSLGYALVVWSSLDLITLALVTPDLLIAVFVYVAAALVLRIHRGAATGATYAALGGVLGLGYLAKAPMFVLALVFLGVAALAGGVSRRSAWRAALGLAAFVAVASPFVTALSLQKGHVTFGESRVLSYGWFVTQIPLRHWQGDADGCVLVHPTRRVLNTPAVYEFASPVGGTYPVWYDPSYWYAGLRAHVSVRQQLRALVESTQHLYGIFLVYLPSSLVVGFLCLALMNRPGHRTLIDLARAWPLVTLGLAGLAMFSLVQALPRYVAPFVVLLWLGLFSAIRLPDAPPWRRLLSVCSGVMALMMGIAIAMLVGRTAFAGARDLLRGESDGANEQWHVAESVRALGLAPGDRVAVIHPPPDRDSWSGMTSWARLARVRIVAEIPPEASDEYWLGAPADRQAAMAAFASAGARTIVTMNIPAEQLGAGWQRLGNTNYHAYAFGR